MSRLLKRVFFALAALLTSLALLFNLKGKTPGANLHSVRSWNLSSETTAAKEAPIMSKDNSYYLSPDLVARVEKFVFFVGYARSGHSIIGALMDAHPHVVMAHEFFLFSNFPVLNMAPKSEWKNNLFQILNRKSAKIATKGEQSSRKVIH